MNIQKRIAALALVVFASCQVKEDIHVNTNNSVDRDMEMHLDKEASTKLVAMAKMSGQGDNINLDSLGSVWNTVTDTLNKSLTVSNGASFSATKWDTATNSAKVHFHMPDLKTYNEFAGKFAQTPAEADKQMPFSGMQKQQLEWRGKDTLVIHLNEGKAEAPTNSEEMTQSLAMVKVMLGLDALASYKADIHLPRAAKSIIAENATLSADKKTVHIERALEDAATTTADEVKIVF